MNTTTQATHTSSLTLSASVQIAAASILAFVILYGVGFSEVDIAHNSAHDARHATTFPCH